MNYLDLLKIEERELLDTIMCTLIAHDEIRTMSVIGSLAKGHYSENSDIDILILVNQENFSVEMCKHYSDELGFNAELNDDAYDYEHNKRNFSLLFKDSDAFINNISDIIKGNQIDIVFKSWAYGGMITDVLLLDIRNAIIIFDKDGRLTDYSNELKHGYPKPLANALKEYNKSFIISRLNALNRFATNPLLSEVIKTELMISFVRYMYAVNGEFNPGLKHIFSNDNHAFLNQKIPVLLLMADLKDDPLKISKLIGEYING